MAGRALRRKSACIFGIEISASEYDDAFKFLIAWEQSRRLNKKDFSSLNPIEMKIELSCYKFAITLVVVGGRVANFPVGFSKDNQLPIIPYGVLAKLIVLHYHDIHHREADTIVTFVRNDVWPVKARKIASAIDARCRICKVKRKHFASQTMGDLPDFRSEMSPPFSVCLMDLFGPLEIRDDVVKRGPRVYKKVWGVVFTCASTRAVHLDVCIDYSTEAVLHTLRRLMSLRGNVRIMFSDPGSQLMGASRELSEWRRGWDMDQLERFGASRGLEWKTAMPNAQHQNGASEAMVKMVKGIMKTMVKVIGDTKLSLNEFNTVLAEVTNLVNERPIGLQPTEQAATDFLSPNSLLLGRSSDRIGSGPFEPSQVFTDNPNVVKTRFLLVQAIVSQYWKVWQKLYFPTLIIRRKWHLERRNLCVGDICLLRDSNAFRGEWRLCEVDKTFPDAKNKVRNVQLRLKPRQGGSKKYVPTINIIVKRHVSDLIVLVPVEERDDVDRSV